MALRWLDDITADDLDSVGGKAASSVNSRQPGSPFRPRSSSPRTRIAPSSKNTGIDVELFEVVDVDTDDSQALAEAAERASN